MKVKGTAVRVLPDYIKKNYTELYDLWLEKLPPASYDIFSKPIFASEWFELYDSHVVPTRVLADITSSTPEEIARKVGHFSAESALKGVYNIFLKIASMKYAIQRVPQFFSTYYDPVFVEMVDTSDGNVVIKFGYTKENETLLYNRNTGWIERFLELAFKPSNLQVSFELKPDVSKPDLYYALFNVKWSK